MTLTFDESQNSDVYTYCGRLLYEGSLDVLLDHHFQKSKDDVFVQDGRRNFTRCVALVSTVKRGRVNEATVYVFSPIEGTALEVFAEIKSVTGGYIVPEQEPAIMSTATELTKVIGPEVLK